MPLILESSYKWKLLHNMINDIMAKKEAGELSNPTQ